MDPAFEMLVHGGLVPAVVAATLVWTSARILPPASAARCPVAIGLSAGFGVGYGLLPSWAPLWPAQYWHWLPWMALGAAIVGPVAQTSGVFALKRCLLLVPFFLGCAALGTPGWPGLQSTRHYWVGFSALAAILAALALGPLPRRLRGGWLGWFLGGSACVTAIAVAWFVSGSLGQLGGIAASALFGCAISGGTTRSFPAAWDAALPAYVVLVPGLAYMAYLNAGPSSLGLLIAAVAPMALWTCAVGPWSRLQGWRAAGMQLLVVAIPLLAAIAQLWLQERYPS